MNFEIISEKELIKAYKDKRPKGKWIDLDDKEEIYASLWECSNCGAVEISNEPPNYCYNCGADMRGEE